MTTSAVSFAAGGTTMSMHGNSVFRGDLLATKQASMQITKEDVRFLKVLLKLDVSLRAAAEHLGLCWQTLLNIVARDECGFGSDGVDLEHARALAMGPTPRGPAACFTPGRGHIVMVRASYVARFQVAVQKCVAHL